MIPKPTNPIAKLAVMISLLAGSVAHAQRNINAEAANDAAAIESKVDQWDNFPSGRMIQFSGHSWRVKGGGPNQRYGPGGFPFGASDQSVWVDKQGRLHLRVTQIDGVWHSAEVRLTEPLGHGDYRFTTVGRIDDLDPNLVFGLFLWEYQASYDESNARNVANEFDIEFGTWKDPKRAPAQFVCQPWHHKDSLHPYRFSLVGDDVLSTHTFRWLPKRVECRAWRGGPKGEHISDQQLTQWTYAGPNVPGGTPQVHLNFWCIEEPPARATPQEVIIDQFEFVPVKKQAVQRTITQDQ
ncbi:hypothetical protein CA13_16540 [Planctomycetes bacterium CA13]|uniref:GH16 domain-containing protein n=1 Tax=Novipirellula herctigrandis TaxID=2527986 RepID=A0A5C5Z072_9BACT|nr:hypothetical protein CA13_16540 [Planctomycetes bacterium CA13]